MILKYVIRIFLGAAVLWTLPSCKRPYEKFKRIPPVKPAYEKQRLVKQISKEHLSKPIKSMTLDEAVRTKAYYEDLGREDLIMRLIPHIISLSKDVRLTAQLELELADRFLGEGELEKAQKAYTDFISFYPGDEQIKAARYRLLLATFWMALEPDRDQALTLTSVDLAKKYVQDFPDDSEYAEKVHEILKTCYQALLEGELGLVGFYINKFSYEHKHSAIEAARIRLNHSKESYLPILAGYDERACTLGATLETINKLTEPSPAETLEQAQHIGAQKAMLETLLFEVGQRRQGPHPRDMF